MRAIHSFIMNGWRNVWSVFVHVLTLHSIAVNHIDKQREQDEIERSADREKHRRSVVTRHAQESVIVFVIVRWHYDLNLNVVENI